MERKQKMQLTGAERDRGDKSKLQESKRDQQETTRQNHVGTNRRWQPLLCSCMTATTDAQPPCHLPARSRTAPETRCLPAGTQAALRKNETGCWFELPSRTAFSCPDLCDIILAEIFVCQCPRFITGRLRDTWDYAFVLYVASVQPLPSAAACVH